MYDYNVERIANYLSERRESLGMSDYDLARFSGVSQPTVYRFLSGKNLNISVIRLVKIALAMGVEIGPDLEGSYSEQEYREQRAKVKAERIVQATQGTSSLEGQGLDDETLLEMKERIKLKLLSGPSKDLWAE